MTAKAACGTAFKRCPLCGKIWPSCDEFLDDRSIRLNGYQGNVRRLQIGERARGLLLFTHHTPECGTTLALEAKRFKESVTED